MKRSFTKSSIVVCILSESICIYLIGALFFAIFDNHYVVVQSFHKVVLLELGVVEVDEILIMVVEKNGIGYVKLVANIS